MPDELARLYDEHADALCAFLLNITHDHADTRDTLQEVFQKLARRPGLLDGVEAQQRNFTKDFDEQRGNPRKMIAALLIRQLSLFQQHCAAGQATADLARVAVAIERYRLRHQAVPTVLEQLAPEFLAKVPRDVMSGEALHYRPGSDGSFALYSVGWNGRDDRGGHALEPESKLPDIDWRNGGWPWPRAADLTAAE